VPDTPGDPAFIPGLLTPRPKHSLRQYPVLVLTGPRQAGKSTLLRQLLRGHGWLSLEDPDLREFARGDPRGLLARRPAPRVIDEVQRVPALLSYLQSHVDRGGRMGGWVLSGSHAFALLEAVAQTLAGRAAMLELPPLALPELAGAGRLDATLYAAIFGGGHPAPRARGTPMPRYLAGYVSTDLGRHVRRGARCTTSAASSASCAWRPRVPGSC
jgi:uncharacterized protein